MAHAGGNYRQMVVLELLPDHLAVHGNIHCYPALRKAGQVLLKPVSPSGRRCALLAGPVERSASEEVIQVIANNWLYIT